MMYDFDQHLGTSTCFAERLVFEERELAVEERRIETGRSIQTARTDLYFYAQVLLQCNGPIIIMPQPRPSFAS